MSPQVIAAIVEASIPLCAGLYATLLGHRIVGKKPGADFRYDEWYARHNSTLKIAGPLLILLGIFLLPVTLLAAR